jgi:hypothetical protein
VAWAPFLPLGGQRHALVHSLFFPPLHLLFARFAARALARRWFLHPAALMEFLVAGAFQFAFLLCGIFLCFLSFLLLFVSSWLFRLNLLFPFDYRSTLMVRLFHLHFLLCDLVGLLLSGSFELFMLSLLVQCICLIKCLRDDSFFF